MPHLDTVTGIERYLNVRGYSLVCDVCKVTYNGGNGSDPAVPYRPRGYRFGEQDLLIEHALQLGWTGVEQYLQTTGQDQEVKIDKCPHCSAKL